MIRKHKKYSRPRKLYDSARIKEENQLVEKYGLKNKREIWKAEAKVREFRNRAKELVTASSENQEMLFYKLKAIGLKINSTADVLALTKEDLLKRRLSTVLVEKNIAITPRQARQMISHKKIMIDRKVISSPSHIVSVEEMPLISVKIKKLNNKEVKEGEQNE